MTLVQKSCKFQGLATIDEQIVVKPACESLRVLRTSRGRQDIVHASLLVHLSSHPAPVEECSKSRVYFALRCVGGKIVARPGELCDTQENRDVEALASGISLHSFDRVHGGWHSER